MLIERFVVAFNDGRIEEALRDLSEDYVYVDPSSGPLDRDGHLALMKRVLEVFPDRRNHGHRRGRGRRGRVRSGGGRAHLRAAASP